MDQHDRIVGAGMVDQLRALGVRAGAVLVVHAAFSKVAPVEGGPRALIDALVAALGPLGTLVMPSMSDEDDIPWDVTATPCRGMGVVAETFWRMPGVLRSDNPHAFAALGPRAADIVAAHPLDVPHGLDSPVGRVYELDGQVLLLGVGHDADTTIHLAEVMAAVPYGVTKHITVLREGRPHRLDYVETDHCCERFALADGWLRGRAAQAEGPVGHAHARLFRARDVVAAALQRLRKDPLLFLHPPEARCGECDAARASVGGARCPRSTRPREGGDRVPNL
jgi:aminoglycoside N3'-acetyltransferase